MISLAITGIVTAGIHSFFLATNQTYSDQAVVGRLLWTANNAMTTITQDIRRTGTWFATGHPCVNLFPALVSASNGPPGRVTIRVVLDDPAVRTELGTDQPQTNTTFAVLSSAGFQVNDTAFITDGVQCTRFIVTGVVGGGLQHVPGNDANSTGGAGYTYPAGTSMVYRVSVNQLITYTLDTSDPKTSWLTRDAGSGSIRLVPDIESLSISNVTAGSVTVSLTAKADTRSPSVGADGFRRQALASTVKLRNVGP
jgi:Tfp pilus assembly protein PilW